jgi:hypothetical protein
MTASFWGVDSVAPAHLPVQGSGKATFYEYLVAKNLKPQFFGRYLVGSKEQILTAGEAQYLLSNKCRILPIYREAIPTEKSTALDGATAAGRAITAATALGMPNGVYIYADIEPLWKPSVDYIIGWCTAMSLSKFGGCGGFYCNNWSLSDFMRSYKTAFNKMDVPMKESKINLWCQYPPKGCSQAAASFDFAPARPLFHLSGPVVWQYAINCLKQNIGGNMIGLIDMNLATQRGFDGMWG